MLLGYWGVYLLFEWDMTDYATETFPVVVKWCLVVAIGSWLNRMRMWSTRSDWAMFIVISITLWAFLFRGDPTWHTDPSWNAYCDLSYKAWAAVFLYFAVKPRT